MRGDRRCRTAGRAGSAGVRAAQQLTSSRGLAWVAFLLAAAALLADPPGAAPDGLRAAVPAAGSPALAVDAIALARWIRDAKPGLRVLDIRAAAAFEAYHVPTARHVPRNRLDAALPEPGETVVLYTDDGATAAAAVAGLRARGYDQTFWLEDGLAGWADRILEPTLRADATGAERAEFREIADLARWFGGVPRTDAGAPANAEAPASASARVKAIRRGC